ncbi:hypothetical protein Taro_013013 [Colocasia esculenta]|uniref:Uncharacterized protein n=1 Tax=Colocasia esculenta TaxID=4460 RepID=A0A843UKV3_COLES|nr:hypothetical protein [Colocasia esculenta]
MVQLISQIRVSTDCPSLASTLQGNEAEVEWRCHEVTAERNRELAARVECKEKHKSGREGERTINPSIERYPSRLAYRFRFGGTCACQAGNWNPREIPESVVRVECKEEHKSGRGREKRTINPSIERYLSRLACEFRFGRTCACQAGRLGTQQELINGLE